MNVPEKTVPDRGVRRFERRAAKEVIQEGESSTNGLVGCNAWICLRKALAQGPHCILKCEIIEFEAICA
jgi:hypothetical protein